MTKNPRILYHKGTVVYLQDAEWKRAQERLAKWEKEFGPELRDSEAEPQDGKPNAASPSNPDSPKTADSD